MKSTTPAPFNLSGLVHLATTPTTTKMHVLPVNHPTARVPCVKQTERHLDTTRLLPEPHIDDTDHLLFVPVLHHVLSEYSARYE